MSTESFELDHIVPSDSAPDIPQKSVCSNRHIRATVGDSDTSAASSRSEDARNDLPEVASSPLIFLPTNLGRSMSALSIMSDDGAGCPEIIEISE